MDAVKAFNAETMMVSMMDMKPPISRAKMMAITKAGIKAIKLYKHVVQIIEKFIKRCGPELKVPGLYVVDSIIRQSRHQFGEDKDVFGPRFLKNMMETFQSLYQCPPDDKVKILRVLNLWQKNSVFGMDIIQPLVDMATVPLIPVLENGGTLGGSPAAMVSAQLPSAPSPVTQDQPIGTGVLQEAQYPAVLAQFQNPAALPHLQNMAGLPHFQNPSTLPLVQDPLTFSQSQIPTAFPQPQNTAALPQLQNHAAPLLMQNPAAVPQLQNHAAPLLMQNPAAVPQLQNHAAPLLMQNPAALPQLQEPVAPPLVQNPTALSAIAQFLQSSQGLDLQQVLQTLQQSSANAKPAVQSPAPTQQNSTIAKVLLDRFDYDEEPEPVVEEPKQEEPTPAVNLMHLQQALQSHLLGQLSSQLLPNVQAALQAVGSQSLTGSMQAPGQPVPDIQPPRSSEIPQNRNHSHITAHPQDVPMESSQSRRDERDGRYNRRSRSRSPRRRSSSHSRRSRSGSRSRRSRFQRSHSRSREHRRGSPRSRNEDRRERERKHRGLPPIKREMLSVCTTTLWIGQLDKKTHQQDISSLMEEFGQIESINMIPPRGCAYIVMVHRQDAATALNRLSRSSARINHKPFKIAWALNKGVNSRFKKYWDVEQGVTYIPWSKLKTAEIPALREGGMLDQDTFKPVIALKYFSLFIKKKKEWTSVLEDLLKATEDNRGETEGEPSSRAPVAAAGPQTLMLDKKAWLSVSTLIHPKGVLSDGGQDFVQASSVPPHKTRSPMSLWSLLCALVCSHVGTGRFQKVADLCALRVSASFDPALLLSVVYHFVAELWVERSARQSLQPGRAFSQAEPSARQSLQPGGAFSPAEPSARRSLQPGGAFSQAEPSARQSLQPGRAFSPAEPSAPAVMVRRLDMLQTTISPAPVQDHHCPPMLGNRVEQLAGVPAVSVDVAGSPAASTPAVTSPPFILTDSMDKPEVHLAEPSEGPVSQIDSPEAPVTGSLPAGTLVGERPGAPQHPSGQVPPFTPPFSNNMRPNMPLINMPRPNMHPVPQPMMHQGPMFRERAPGPPRPMGPRGPPGRFRMPMPGPHEDFPPHREGFPPQGPIEGDHWNHGPPRNDWRNYGPNRGPEWFEEGPPIRRGGWGQGGPRGPGHFGN
ncbi:hypothetical protein NFI96_018370 [Prochilodus magdalenae]|nr:hypothetical protein NFI96_018370 [Prochilodus magdalenae]